MSVLSSNPNPGLNQVLFSIENLPIKTFSGKETFVKHWEMGTGSSWALVSNPPEYLNTIRDILLGKKSLGIDHFKREFNREEIQMIPFNATKLFSHSWEMYYQKRFNQFDSDSIPEVREFLRMEAGNNEENPILKSGKTRESIFHSLGLVELLERKIHQLSHGEMKRFLLGRSLLKSPRILILDNPLEGVDPENQRILNTVFHSLLKEGIALIFLFQEEKTPDFIQKILYLQEGSGITYTREEWNKREPLQNPASEKSEWKIRGNRSDDYEEESRKILEMENFNLHYGQVQVLKNLNWTVYEGDRWLVFGPNGSGKSTLLSLMNGDHPQAYQESFRWMGRTRGSGESIWDIKKPIGFMSPEMLLHLPHDQNAFQMLASGLMDTLGLFRKLKPEEKERVESLAEFWKLSPHLNRPIRSLSLQDQRILLIARAFIKNPEILILDEPFQGLSPDRISEQKAILEEIFSKSKQTLIFTSHKPSDIPSLIHYRLDLGAGIK